MAPLVIGTTRPFRGAVPSSFAPTATHAPGLAQARPNNEDPATGSAAPGVPLVIGTTTA